MHDDVRDVAACVRPVSPYTIQTNCVQQQALFDVGLLETRVRHLLSMFAPSAVNPQGLELLLCCLSDSLILSTRS